jgi:hypothetical protein
LRHKNSKIRCDDNLAALTSYLVHKNGLFKMIRNMGACDRLAGETHIFTEDSARFIHGHGRAFKNQK